MLKNTDVRQLACAYQLKGKIFIQGYSKTTVGLRKLYGPIFIVEENNDEALGKAVINALNECKVGIQDVPPKEYDPKKSPMVISTGMKSWNILMKNSKSTEMEVIRDNCIIFTPRRFLGVSGDKKGYEGIKDKKITSDSDPEHLGHALLEAFSYSENPYLKES